MLNEKTQARALRRLRIIRGQIDGLERMISEGTYCVEVLTQLAAVQQALRGVGQVLVRNHLETCVTQDMRRGRGDRHYDELMDIMYKLTK